MKREQQSTAYERIVRDQILAAGFRVSKDGRCVPNEPQIRKGIFRKRPGDGLLRVVSGGKP